MEHRAALVTVLVALGAVACGSITDGGVPGPSSTAGPAAPPASAIDDGAPSTTYPAFQPDMPRLQNKGGRILANPVAVTVTWNDSANAAAFEGLVDAIGATPYWRDVVGEYGVGPLTSGAANHVRMTTPITLSNDPSQDPVQPIVDLVTKSLSDTATSKWPAPTDQSVYVLYFSGRAAEQLCQEGMGGMHESVKVNGRDVAYALVLECKGDPTLDPREGAMISASHELAEAVTDPYPDVDPAWQGLDGDHLAWELFQQGQDENGDLCEFYEDSYAPLASPAIAHQLQRQWSNKSALAGHAPCVTAPKEPYFNVTPLDAHDDLVADFGQFRGPFDRKSKGLHVGVGETRTVTLGFYSDAATDAFEVSAVEQDPFADMKEDGPPPPPPDNLELAFDADKTSGKNGEKTHLSVKVKKSSGIGVHVVLLLSRLGSVQHVFPLLVGGNPADPAKRLGPDGTPAGTRIAFADRTFANRTLTPRIRPFGLARR